jgi:hypothetical protein
MPDKTAIQKTGNFLALRSTMLLVLKVDGRIINEHNRLTNLAATNAASNHSPGEPQGPRCASMHAVK